MLVGGSDDDAKTDATVPPSAPPSCPTLENCDSVPAAAAVALLAA